MIPDLSTVCVIALVLILTVILDRLLIRPVTAVMQQRERAVREAHELAESSRARAEAAAGELETKTRAARADVYKQMDEMRRKALERRAGLVADTRKEVEGLMTAATERVRAQADAARMHLDRDADVLAETIVERVLGRKAS
jgi:F0F1-type ATP synthase membrane subunit b/b'